MLTVVQGLNNKIEVTMHSIVSTALTINVTIFNLVTLCLWKQ
jgi:hypothetical protein